MAVFLELAPGDTLVIGTGTRIVMDRKSGQRARLKIDSDEDVERIKAGEPVPVRQGGAASTAAPTANATPPLAAPSNQRAWLQRRPMTGSST